jgi:hypothetical protein
MSRPDGGTGIGSRLRTRSRKAPACEPRSTRSTSGKSVAATSSRVTIRAPIKFGPDIVSFLPARRFKLPDGRLLKKALRKAPGLEGPAWPENENRASRRLFFYVPWLGPYSDRGSSVAVAFVHKSDHASEDYAGEQQSEPVVEPSIEKAHQFPSSLAGQS